MHPLGQQGIEANLQLPGEAVEQGRGALHLPLPGK
jgi:hypothetical protein